MEYWEAAKNKPPNVKNWVAYCLIEKRQLSYKIHMSACLVIVMFLILAFLKVFCNSYQKGDLILWQKRKILDVKKILAGFAASSTPIVGDS